MNHHQGTERPTISYTLDGTLLNPTRKEGAGVRTTGVPMEWVPLRSAGILAHISLVGPRTPDAEAFLSMGGLG